MIKNRFDIRAFNIEALNNAFVAGIPNTKICLFTSIGMLVGDIEFPPEWADNITTLEELHDQCKEHNYNPLHSWQLSKRISLKELSDDIETTANGSILTMKDVSMFKDDFKTCVFKTTILYVHSSDVIAICPLDLTNLNL